MKMRKFRKITFGLLIVVMIVGGLVAGVPQDIDAKPTIYFYMYEDNTCESGIGISVVVTGVGDDVWVFTGCLG